MGARLQFRLARRGRVESQVFKSKNESAAEWDGGVQLGEATSAGEAASLHVAEVRAVLAAVRRAHAPAAHGRWPIWVSVTDAGGTPVCPPLPTTLEALQGLREDLLYLGYVPGRMPSPGTYVFRHARAVLRP